MRRTLAKRQEYTSPENNNSYPDHSYWLLGNTYNNDDTIVLRSSADELWDNCRDACDNCRICRKANPFYQNCWRSCDRCRYCHLRNHRSLKCPSTGPAYYNRHPYTPDPSLPSFDLITESDRPKALEKPRHPLAKFTTTNVCGPELYKQYIRRYNDYVQCQRCQMNGSCWSRYQQKCVGCDEGHLAKSCETKFGCPNQMGPMFPYVPPKDPLYTDCRPCWRPGYTTL